MAPIPVSLDTVDQQLKDIIANLYNLMCQSHDYQRDSTGPAMTAEITSLLSTLSHLTHSSSSLSISLPPEIIDYVERGRNPDIYNREFVEAIQRANQQSKGRSEAFAAFRDVLAGEIAGQMPELKEGVGRVVRGGSVRLEGSDARRTGGA